MIGPCAIENEAHALAVAHALKELSIKLNFSLIYKSSFEKANRTSPKSYRGVGIDEGLRILAKVRSEYDLPIVTDLHDASQVDAVSSCVDIIQIPAFLCRQTPLLEAAGKANTTVFIKKGQFVSPQAMKHAAQKVMNVGSSSVILGERGYAFGYGDLIVDFRNFPIMKSFGFPVIYDATHSVQRPSALGASSGGDRQFVSDLACAAVSQGIAGMFIEVHEEPERAPCDGPNSLRLSQLEEFLRYVIDLDTWVKSRPRPISS